MERTVGYGVQELRDMALRGEEPDRENCEGKFGCPYCGHVIDPENEPVQGPDSVVAFFD